MEIAIKELTRRVAQLDKMIAVSKTEAEGAALSNFRNGLFESLDLVNKFAGLADSLDNTPTLLSIGEDLDYKQPEKEKETERV